MEDFEVCLGIPNSNKMEWFKFPIKQEEINERFSVDKYDGEYAVIDYKFPCDLDEVMTIEEMNRLFYKINELPAYIVECLREFLKYIPNIYDIDEKEMYTFKNCFSMEEVAYYVINEELVQIEVSDEVKPFFDYKKYGEHLEKNGNWILTKIGMCDVNYRNAI